MNIKRLKDNFSIEIKNNRLYLYESWDLACLQVHRLFAKNKKLTYNQALDRQIKNIGAIVGYKFTSKFWKKKHALSCLIYERV